MIDQIIWDPFFFTFLFYALALGILHTALPCEDKAIFLFWSLGISKSAKKSVLILVLYGLGLIAANMIISIISITITYIPLALFNYTPDSNALNLFGAISSIIAALILLIFIFRGNYKPHSKRNNDYSPHKFNWANLKTPFIFGTFAGFAPCIFEFFIYSEAVKLSVSHHFIGGLLYVLFFSIGTFIGLFPLALAKLGTAQIIKRKKDNRSKITYAMTSLIILFNLIIIIFSLFNIAIITIDTPPAT